MEYSLWGKELKCLKTQNTTNFKNELTFPILKVYYVEKQYERMRGEEMLGLYLIDLIVTIFGYLLVPMMLVIVGKKYSWRTIRKIAIINSIVVWVIFRIITTKMTGESGNSYALILWGYVGYWIMNKKCLEETPEEGEQS